MYIENFCELISENNNEQILEFIKKNKENLKSYSLSDDQKYTLLDTAIRSNNLEAILILAEFGIDFDIQKDDMPVLDYYLEKHKTRSNQEISPGEVALFLNAIGVEWSEDVESANNLRHRESYEIFFKTEKEFKKTQDFIAKYYFYSCANNLVNMVKSILKLSSPNKASYNPENNTDQRTQVSAHDQIRVTPGSPGPSYYSDIHNSATHGSSSNQGSLLKGLEQLTPYDPFQLTPEQEELIKKNREKNNDSELDKHHIWKLKIHDLIVIPINYQDGSGNTGLHIAAEKLQKSVLEELIQSGADLKIVNKDGKTADEIYKERVNAIRSSQSNNNNSNPVAPNGPGLFNTQTDSAAIKRVCILLRTICNKQSNYDNFKKMLDANKERNPEQFDSLMNGILLNFGENNKPKFFDQYYLQYKTESNSNPTVEFTITTTTTPTFN